MLKAIRKIGIKAANAAMARGASKKEARIVARLAEYEARKERVR